MKLTAPLLLAFVLAASPAASGAPHYFTAVRAGDHHSEGEDGKLNESYRVMREMVKLASARNVRLTLLFGARYAAFISSDTARLAELKTWKDSGHEVGAYHQGPDTGAWDGYSDLSPKQLARMRRDGGTGAPPPGHGDFFAAIERLEPALKTSCISDRRDSSFQSAGPPYEICRVAGGQASKGAGYSGANDFITLSAEGRKHLSVFHPADRQGIAAAKKAFSSMQGGLYGAIFDSAASDFGPFYVWLSFLGEADPGCARSRTVNTAVNGGILEEKKAAGKKPAARKKEKKQDKPEEAAAPGIPAAGPPQAVRTEIPRLKPVPSFFYNPPHLRHRNRNTPGHRESRGRCGDGSCDTIERFTGACPRDCGR